MNINVNVRISHWTRNVEPYNGATIEITDEASRLRIATVTLLPDQFCDMMEVFFDPDVFAAWWKCPVCGHEHEEGWEDEL